MTIEELVGFDGQIHVVDVGAAAIAEIPPYKVLLDRGLARLTAVDGDDRQQDAIRSAYGSDACFLSLMLGDGQQHTLYLAKLPESGMTSLLRPDPAQLAFFNGFPHFGQVDRTIAVDTVRMGDVSELGGIDYLKMDIQGAELMVLENAGSALDVCVAIQVEASFIPLYEGQPLFGDIDRWMRSNGYLPHALLDLKRWSIAPTIVNGDIKIPFNQLLECDILYIKELVDLSSLSDDQVRKIALIAAYSAFSPDLCIHAMLELERRGALPEGQHQRANPILSRAGSRPQVSYF